MLDIDTRVSLVQSQHFTFSALYSPSGSIFFSFFGWFFCVLNSCRKGAHHSQWLSCPGTGTRMSGNGSQAQENHVSGIFTRYLQNTLDHFHVAGRNHLVTTSVLQLGTMFNKIVFWFCIWSHLAVFSGHSWQYWENPMQCWGSNLGQLHGKCLTICIIALVIFFKENIVRWKYVPEMNHNVVFILQKDYNPGR